MMCFVACERHVAYGSETTRDLVEKMLVAGRGIYHDDLAEVQRGVMGADIDVVQLAFAYAVKMGRLSAVQWLAGMGAIVCSLEYSLKHACSHHVPVVRWLVSNMGVTRHTLLGQGGARFGVSSIGNSQLLELLIELGVTASELSGSVETALRVGHRGIALRIAEQFGQQSFIGCAARISEEDLEELRMACDDTK